MKILLKEIMESKEMSIKQVSIASNIPTTTIFRILKGTCPRMHTMEKLAKGLKVRITDLFDSKYK